jgi:hypothetical protein
MYYQQYNTIESASSAVEPTVHKSLHILRDSIPYTVVHFILCMVTLKKYMTLHCY